MKPQVKEAFDLIVQVTGQLNASREGHVKIQQALQTIENELNPKEDLKK